MHRLVRWSICIAYCYSQLLGVISFSYNVDTGYAHKKPFITIYCIIVNGITVSIVPYFVMNIKIKRRPPGHADLHQKLYIFMILLRLVSVILSIASNWMNRNDFIRNINRLQEYREAFQEKHSLMTRCCELSDQLDELAHFYSDLQNLGDHLNRMYYVQGVCVILVLYMNNVCMIYMGYMMAQHEQLWPQLSQAMALCLVPIVLFFYYLDAYLFIFLILRMVDAADRPGLLLKESQPWLATLDERLEKSLQSFSLQTSAFPWNRSLLYLFDITRPMVFATLSSTMSNAIVLMQYDYKYRKR
ncbi:putative gustatory receptor 36a [Haematobia irritans]|uniref:putative gustatory receptor 36a n=1 Tax=Haematobia irritans TaxID=7368 RepID=UPI003F505101